LAFLKLNCITARIDRSTKNIRPLGCLLAACIPPFVLLTPAVILRPARLPRRRRKHGGLPRACARFARPGRRRRQRNRTRPSGTPKLLRGLTTRAQPPNGDTVMSRTVDRALQASPKFFSTNLWENLWIFKPARLRTPSPTAISDDLHRNVTFRTYAQCQSNKEGGIRRGSRTRRHYQTSRASAYARSAQHVPRRRRPHAGLAHVAFARPGRRRRPARRAVLRGAARVFATRRDRARLRAELTVLRAAALGPLVPWSQVLAIVVAEQFSPAIRQEARRIGFTGEIERE